MVPRASSAEAALVDGLDVAPVETLRELVQFLSGELPASAPAVDAGALLSRPRAAGTTSANCAATMVYGARSRSPPPAVTTS